MSLLTVYKFHFLTFLNKTDFRIVRLAALYQENRMGPPLSSILLDEEFEVKMLSQSVPALESWRPPGQARSQTSERGCGGAPPKKMFEFFT